MISLKQSSASSTREPAAAPVERASAAVSATTTTTRRYSSRELLAGAQEIEIEHDGSLYRLRRTALGKLILTK